MTSISLHKLRNLSLKKKKNVLKSDVIANVLHHGKLLTNIVNMIIPT